MANHNNIPDLQVFGKGRGDFKLPTGYVDKDGRVFNRIYLREMTGVEDDIMDDDELNLSERMTRVIANCTEKLATADSGEDGKQPTVIDDKATIVAAVSDNLDDGGLALTIPDRMAALLFIRMVSGGDRYQLDGRPCPVCSKGLKNKHIFLSKLEINYYRDPKLRRVRVKLPRSGKMAVLKMLTASNERKITESRPSLRDVKSLAILSRLESIDDQVVSGDPDKDTDLVRSLPKLDRTKLIQTFNLMEGGVETDVTVRCTNQACATEFTFDLDLGQVFLVAGDGGVLGRSRLVLDPNSPIRDWRGWLTVDGQRFGIFRPLGSRAMLEYEILCLAEAYHWDPLTIMRMPSSQRHRFVKMRQQIAQEMKARSNNQTTVPQPSLPTGISPRPAAEKAFGIDYSS